MLQITRVGRVMVSVADQDAAIAFYTDALGFKLAADTPWFFFRDHDANTLMLVEAS
jgi:catechol 2,3-dioxygenase-like lactoylglutathione lyase family enzyme